jgi:hypothetical protein
MPHLPPPTIFFSSVSIPTTKGGPGKAVAQAKSHDLAHFEAISQTSLPQLPSVAKIGFASLPRLPNWQRQSLYSPQHASERVSRQMTEQKQALLAQYRHSDKSP